MEYDIAIIGGGLAGLTAANELAAAGFSVVLFEQYAYPQEKVCGEYVSNEVKPYLTVQGLFPADAKPATVNTFCLSLPNGRSAEAHLPLGGFGISRGIFDQHLCRQLQQKGAEVIENTRIVQLNRTANGYLLRSRDEKEWQAKLVLGAWGKRSVLDNELARQFTEQRSPYVGIKYHITGNFSPDTVALHVFKKGYCGISPIEGRRWNLCYLVRREMLREAGSVAALEEKVLCKNPYLKAIWQSAEFLTEKPLVINEISFRPKSKQEKGMLMLGDTAGLISPLCGNGMAMAIHSGALAARLTESYWQSGENWRLNLLKAYSRAWRQQFGVRMFMGRRLQPIFLNGMGAHSLYWLMKSPAIARTIIRTTHGKPQRLPLTS